MKEQKAELKALPVKDVIPTADNPRRAPKVTDQDIKELAASIEAHGLLHPVVVREHPAKKGKWDLRCGARRLAAHKAIKAEAILAVVREMTDEQALEATALENLQRQDLTPLEEGRSIKMLLKARPDAAAVASNIGRSVSWVYRRAALANLCEPWAELFETEGSTISGWSAAHLEQIARLDWPIQKKLYEEMHPETQASYRAISVAELGRLIAVRFVSLKDAPKEFLLMSDPDVCNGCPFNSASQPDLFGDDGADDAMCHNPECYEKKRMAWARQGMEDAIRKHGSKLVFVTEYGYANDDKCCMPLDGQQVLKCWEYTDDADALSGVPSSIKRPAFRVDLDGWGDSLVVVLNDDLRAWKNEARADKESDEDASGDSGSNDKIDNDESLESYDQRESRICDAVIDVVTGHIGEFLSECCPIEIEIVGSLDLNKHETKAVLKYLRAIGFVTDEQIDFLQERLDEI